LCRFRKVYCQHRIRPIIFADLWQIDRWNFNTIRSAAMFLVWIVFTAAAKVIPVVNVFSLFCLFKPEIHNTKWNGEIQSTDQKIFCTTH
jgi:hypothetical protein